MYTFLSRTCSCKGAPEVQSRKESVEPVLRSRLSTLHSHAGPLPLFTSSTLTFGGRGFSRFIKGGAVETGCSGLHYIKGSLLYNTGPIHCTPPLTAPPL